MEPQNQVRLETLFTDFYFQSFWNFYYVDGVGDMLPPPKAWAYCNQWSQSGRKLCLLVKLVFLLASSSWCMLRKGCFIYIASSVLYYTYLAFLKFYFPLVWNCIFPRVEFLCCYIFRVWNFRVILLYCFKGEKLVDHWDRQNI